MKKSVWSDSIALPQFNSLSGDTKTDVLIIGGGICGILCAFALKKAEIDYILIEGSKIASGITKNTTAKITSQHALIYDKLIKSYGTDIAKAYLKANQNAILEYEKLCRDIDCDFEKKDAYTYSLSDREKIEKEVLALSNLGFDADFLENTNLPFKISGAVRFKNQAQFNPLKFISHIASGLNIYEDTFAQKIEPMSVITNRGRITAKKIIVTTHFPFINTHGNYFLKLYQHRSYVSAFENAPNLNGMFVDEDKKGMSFRNYDNLLLIGGGGHRTGKQGPNWKAIDEFVKKYYPDAKLKYQWATQDCISLDSIPYIGMYSKNTPELYVATGFNKWGMTSAMIASQILCDMVQEKENEFSKVFSPDRSILKPQLLINGVEAVTNLLTPTVKRCPHMGCALKWNKAEHTWDCPCHGSRFDNNGNLIDNPAKKDI